jgi:PKD repeat protein
VYRGSAYPFAETTYLYADYATGQFTWVTFDEATMTELDSGRWDPPGGLTAASPVWLEVNPADGYYYYIHFGWGGNGQVRRFRHIVTSDPQPPSITLAMASGVTGPAPLTVSFTGAATDPDDDPISYEWDFGDSSTSTSASPSHTYDAEGVYQAVLRVSDGSAVVTSAPIEITVGRPPTALITEIVGATSFDAGDVMTIRGEGQDPDDGSLTGSSLTWRIDFLHNEHAHPYPVEPPTGSSATLTVPTSGHDFGGDTRYRVILTATDSDGLVGTDEVILTPNKVQVALASNLPAGHGEVDVDGITQQLPTTIDTVRGFTHGVSVPATVCVDQEAWQFAGWSDGGARTHDITALAGQLEATYVSSDQGGCRSTVTVRAHGTTGVEQLALRIDGVTVTTFTLSTSLTDHVFDAPGPVDIDQIQLAFLNNGTTNGVDRNVRVDHVTLDTATFQTEAPTTHSTGTWTAATGCSPGNKKSEWLHCTGAFTYA